MEKSSMLCNPLMLETSISNDQLSKGLIQTLIIPENELTFVSARKHFLHYYGFFIPGIPDSKTAQKLLYLH